MVNHPNRKPLPIPVGFQYEHVATGKNWIVTGLRPGGVCEIHQVGRHVAGEMYARDIRAAIQEGRSKQVERTPEADAILRRIQASILTRRSPM